MTVLLLPWTKILFLIVCMSLSFDFSHGNLPPKTVKPEPPARVKEVTIRIICPPFIKGDDPNCVHVK